MTNNDRRKAFVHEVWLFCEPGEPPRWRELRRAIGGVWTSRDVMPKALCATLELPEGSSYAQGAGELKKRVEAERDARERDWDLAEYKAACKEFPKIVFHG